jgi:hypothetical protein
MPGHDTLFRYPWVMKSGQDGRLEKNQDFPNLLFGFHLSLEYNDSLF